MTYLYHEWPLSSSGVWFSLYKAIYIDTIKRLTIYPSTALTPFSFRNAACSEFFNQLFFFFFNTSPQKRVNLVVKINRIEQFFLAASAYCKTENVSSMIGDEKKVIVPDVMIKKDRVGIK